MRILVVTQYFQPENFRINGLCQAFCKQGHTVTVLTGLPNYPEGKFYKGYSFFKNNSEIWEGIPIIRVPLMPRMQNKIGLLLNYISFIISGCCFAKFSKKKEFDLIYVFEVSPITVALPAIIYKKRIKKPLVMNVQDLWPENVEAIMGIQNKVVLKGLNRLVDFIYRHCDLLLTSSQCFVDNIIARGHESNKVKFWPQYCEQPLKLDHAEIRKKAQTEMTKGFKIVFTGNIGEAQGLDVVLEAAAQTKENPQIKWFFIGDGRAKDRLQQKAIAQKIDSLFFLGRKPENEIPYYLEQADCALLVLSSNAVFDMTLPAKLQTYMACGKPILASVNGETAEIIQTSQSGYCCDAGDSQGLARLAIEMSQASPEVLKRMAQKSEIYFEENFTKEKLLNTLFEYMNELE